MIETVKDKFGVGPDGKSLHHQRAGRMGGLKKGDELNSPKGFGGMDPAKRSAAGKLGGSISRKKAKVNE